MVTETHSTLRARIDECGYTVVDTGIEPEKLDAVTAEIAAHLGFDPRDPGTWDRPEARATVGGIEMYHYPSMWAIRQDPRLHQIFAGIHGSPALWVSIDRVSCKLPATDGEAGPGLPLHWDTDITRYPDLPFAVQGVLALADTDEDMGGFCCSPEAYHDLSDLLARTPAGQRPDLSSYPAHPVPLRAGQIVIWSTLLAHGNGSNHGRRPRLAQYVSMSPARSADEEARHHRIEAWQHNRPAGDPRHFPGDPRRIEERRDSPTLLSPLGRRLLGLDPWP